MRRLLLVLTFFLLSAPGYAQRVDIDFPGLAERASETVDVTLDGSMLRLAAKFLSNEDPDERAVREMVGRLQGIYVRSYEFEKDWEYDRGIVGKVRSQLGPGWKKIVNVRSRMKENVEVYVDAREGDTIGGLVVISAEPRELTIVNLVGPIDLEKLASIEGQFGIPKISREREK